MLRYSRLLNSTINRVFKCNSFNQIDRAHYPVQTVWKYPVAGLRTQLPWFPKVEQHQVMLPHTEAQEELALDVIKEIDDQIAKQKHGRLFAIIHICGKQFKITETDLIIIQGYWPPTIGNKLVLEKVLLVGSKDFTLVGRPILNRELVSVDATVIEKTLSHIKTRFRFRKRKQFRRINFYRTPFTVLRINSITINGKIDERKEVEGLDKIF